MPLTRVEAVSPQGTLLNLPLDDSPSGYLIDSIEGLEPVKATISSISFAQSDGSSFQSARREERNIKLRIILEPDWGVETVRDLRRHLYTYFMPKGKVDLRFYSDDAETVWISGRVESFETPLFSADPAVDISIICFDPDFFEPVPVAFSGNTTDTTVTTTVDYLGSVETGLLFTLNVDRALSEFTIYLQEPGGDLRQLDFEGSLLAGDVLRISTVPGDKYARLTRASVETSFLYGVSPQSTWLELQPGENLIRVYATGLPIPYDVEYVRKYGGL